MYLSTSTNVLDPKPAPIWTYFNPWVFSKVMKPVVGNLRHMGIHIVICT